MSKNIQINYSKQVNIQNSPFKIILYVLKNRNEILIEDPLSGKSILAHSSELDKFIKFSKILTPWMKTFNHQYIKIDNDQIAQFMPLYLENNRFANLTFKINKNFAPNFKTKKVAHIFDNNPLREKIINVVDNTIDETSNTNTTYDHLYQNVKDFEVENFKLEMFEKPVDFNTIYDENFEPLKIPYITCRLPMFQIYSILEPYGNSYSNKKIFMKIDDKLYRFPYGNSSTNDKLCLGYWNTRIRNQSEPVGEIAYVHIITTEFNGDYGPHLKCDNTIVTTFDINWIREKVNRNDFAFSFMDALFYLSQCKSARDVNINIFLLSPNVPEEILKSEGIEQLESTVTSDVAEETVIEEPEQNIVLPRAEFTTTNVMRLDGTTWLARIPIELLHERYNPVDPDPRIQFIRQIERADYEDGDGNIVFAPVEEQINITHGATTQNNITTIDWINATASTANTTANVVRREVVTGVQQEPEEVNRIQTEQGEVEIGVIQPIIPIEHFDVDFTLTRDGVTFNEQPENNLTNIQETARQETGRINNIDETNETIIHNEVENAENQPAVTEN